MKQINCGFIGNGKSTNRYHLPYILQKTNKFKVKTIFQRDLLKDEWKRIEAVHYTNQLDELLNDKDIDLVIVSTPLDSHFEYAKRVLEANKHCVVEKPFTPTLSEAQMLFDLAKAKGLMIQCYQNRRFDSDLLTAQKLIKEGLLGDLLELELTFDYDRPEIPQGITHFKATQSNFYGHGCHALDQVISLFGKPDRVVYDVRQSLGDGRFNDIYDVDLFYGNFKASVKASYFRVLKRPSLTLVGRNGSFVKISKDKQEEYLKQYIWPNDSRFGVDQEEDYGTLYYANEHRNYKTLKIETVVGDYGLYYDALYETLINHQAKLVKDEHTLWQIEMLEEGIKGLK